MNESERMAEITRGVWDRTKERPSDEVMDLLATAAKRGFAWTVVPLDKLTPANLHWLGLEGFVIAKLLPGGERAGGWRLTWMKVPVGSSQKDMVAA